MKKVDIKSFPMSDRLLKEENGIVFEILQEKDLEETAVLISEVFTKGEPSVRYFGITAKEYHYIAKLYCKKGIEEGFSVIAKDKGKIVAFLISEDFDSSKPEGIEKIDRKIAIDMAIVDAIEEDAKANKKEGERRFHIFLGGTEKEYVNRGIMTTLIDESIKLAKSNKFTNIIAEPTGLVTQHLFKKFGFEQKKMIEYKKFVLEGKNIYDKLEGPIGILLMEKRFNRGFK
ncbi:GNAT family N-acetyltransferase [bacterium]|nr:GNAT family N-acetyltransferase [bacterium]